ncbi:MAG: hypothetical protein HZB16_00280 [Armatimonadetes bacterium]|nr:hypothetical protein [Armatimonadota bacterium]
MATTLDQVIDYLQHDNWRFRLDTDSDLIVCRGEGANGRWPIEVRLSEDGHCLHLRVPKVVSLGESPHVPTLLASLLELHFRLKLGRFGLDPSDGEVDCEVVVPLEDAPLTFRQFRRSIGTLLLLVDQQAPRLRALLATGRDPDRDDEQQQFDRFLDELARAMGLTREALARRLAEDGPA